MDGLTSETSAGSVHGSVGKFQRVEVEIQGAEGYRAYRKNPSSDGYLNPGLRPAARGVRSKRKSADADFLQPYLSNQGLILDCEHTRPHRHSYCGVVHQPQTAAELSHQHLGVAFGMAAGESSQTDRSKSAPMGSTGFFHDLRDTAVSEEARVHFSSDVLTESSLTRAASIQRKGTPGVGLMADLADMASDYCKDERLATDGQDDDPTKVRSISFSQDTKLGPSLGKAPSIQRKGTPGIGLMADLADMATEVQGGPMDSLFDADEDVQATVGGVRFSEDTKAGPRLGKAPSIQRKGTPGAALMSNLADFASNTECAPGANDPFAPDDDDHDMQERHSFAVRFTQDTKLGPSLGKAPSIQRKGTPGVGLMGDLADMATEVQGGPMDSPFDADEDVQDMVGGVRFSEDTKAGPRLGKAPSIQRKGTPGAALMSNLADFASNTECAPGAYDPFAPDDDDHDMQERRSAAVRFTQDTKLGPSLGKAPSIQRKGTPGVGLMADLADMATEVHGEGIFSPFDEDVQDMVGGVRFSEDTKAGPRLGKAPSIQRKGTPGAALMANLVFEAANLSDKSIADGHVGEVDITARFAENANQLRETFGCIAPKTLECTTGGRAGPTMYGLASDATDNLSNSSVGMEEGPAQHANFSFENDTFRGSTAGDVATRTNNTAGNTPVSALLAGASSSVRIFQNDASRPVPVPMALSAESSRRIQTTTTQISFTTQQPPRPSALFSRRASTSSTEPPPTRGKSLLPRSCNSFSGQMPDLSRQLRKVSSEVSAIFQSAPQSATPPSMFPAETAVTVKLVTPTPRVGRVSFTSDDGIDYDMTPEPLPQPSSLQYNSASMMNLLSTGQSPCTFSVGTPNNQDDDVSMDGLTAAMAELGPRSVIQ